MPRFITIEEINSILESGDFGRLIGTLEDDHLECKAIPHNLTLSRDKMECAKDISSLANTDGGIILIGVETGRDPLHQGDFIRNIRAFPRDQIDFTQYQNVLSEWVVPSIWGLEFKWHPSAANGDAGIASIFVPKETSRERPYIVAKVVETTGRIVGSHIGLFERARDNSLPMKPGELRDRIKDGGRFAELDSRLRNIEEMLGRLTADRLAQVPWPPGPHGPPVPPHPPFTAETVFERVERARRELGYEGKPAFSLAAWPLQPTEFPGLFESHEAPIVQLLEHPPRLRDAGFDFAIQRPSSIIEGRLRRCIAPEYKTLEIWRDGPLILVVPGDDWDLCWAMHSTPESGLRINSLALAETVYLFCDWSAKAYRLAYPSPDRFVIRVMFSHMDVNGRAFTLNPLRPNEFNLNENRRVAPMATGQHFEIEVERAAAEPGVLAYRLLSDIYAWFGFNATEMPFLSQEGPPRRIDPMQLC